MVRGGRMTTYTPKVAGEILRRIANGESLIRICGQGRKRGLPERSTVYDWLAANDRFRQAYVLARRAQSEFYIDQMIEIADREEEGRRVGRDRLRVETRRWVVAAMAPQLYAERLATMGGTVAEVMTVEEDDHLAAKVAAILDAARRRKEANAGR